MSENLVARLQAWRESVVLPRWVIDDVKELVSELAQAQADVKALLAAWYESPQDSVPETLDDAFQDIERRGSLEREASR